MDVTFPYNVRFQSVEFHLVGRSATGGTGLSGAMTRVASNSAHWRATATFVIYGHEPYIAWRGFVSAMQGTLGETNVPAWSRIIPFDQNGGAMSRTDAVSVGATSIADNAGLGQTAITHATLKDAASLRDTVIQVEYADTTGIRPGHCIGIGDRFHEVVYSYGDTEGETTLQISPPLREDYAADTRVILDRPQCKMRFADEQQGVLPYNTRPMQTVTVEFVEVY